MIYQECGKVHRRLQLLCVLEVPQQVLVESLFVSRFRIQVLAHPVPK